MRVTVIIPAAGRGSRLGTTVPKQYLPLAGVPMLARTLAVFESAAVIDRVVVVVAPDDESCFRTRILDAYEWTKIGAIVPGGDVRQESVARGLDAVDRETEIVAVHDAARPLVTAGLIRRVIEAAASSGAAVAALPVVDTLKRRERSAGLVSTVDREGLWTAQTPQAFRAGVFREAVARAKADGFVGTDDASLVERLGVRVTLVEGERSNFKITRTEDVSLAEGLLAGLPDPFRLATDAVRTESGLA